MRAFAVGAALLIGALGIAVMHQAWLLGLYVSNNAGPGFVPFWAGCALAVLGPIEAARLATGGECRSRLWEQTAERGSVLILLSALSIYAFLLEPLGFVTATFLFVLAVMKAWARLGTVVSIISALLTAGFIRIVFMSWLQMPLPTGWLGI